MAKSVLYGPEQLETYFSVNFQPDVSLQELIESNQNISSKDFLLLDSYLINNLDLAFQDYANNCGYKSFSGMSLKKKYEKSNNLKLFPNEFVNEPLNRNLLVNYQYGNGDETVKIPFFSYGHFYKLMETSVDHKIFLFDDVDSSYRKFLNENLKKDSFLGVVPKDSVLAPLSNKVVDKRTFSPFILGPFEGKIVSVSTFDLLDKDMLSEVELIINDYLSDNHLVLAVFFRSDGSRIPESRMFPGKNKNLSGIFDEDNLFDNGLIKMILVRFKQNDLKGRISLAEYEVVDAIGESFKIDKSNRPTMSDGSIDMITSSYIN